jgi:nitrogen fixation NifU-like protein
MLTSKGEDPGDEDEVGDGVAFAGVSKYPARVKCALLGWMAFTAALTQAGVDIGVTSASSPVSSALPNTITGSGTTSSAAISNAMEGS